LFLALAACSTADPATDSRSGSSSQADDDDDAAGSSDESNKTPKPTTKADAGKATATVPKPDAGSGTPTKPSLDAGTVGTATNSPFCEVLSIVKTKCGECHSSELAFGAPMSLTSYEDFTANGPVTKTKKVYELVGARIHDTAKPMPPKNQPVLTAAELSTIDAWVAAKAPAPKGTCAPQEATPTADAGIAVAVDEWPADCEEKFKFLANDNGQPHSVAAGYEGYVDFYFPMPWKDNVQGVAFKPVIDNKKVLHHWILYQGQNSFLNGWSPGKPYYAMPLDVGIYLPSGTTGGQLKMTTHYNNKSSGAKAEKDSSGVEVCITRKMRKNTATTFPFTASATAPAGKTQANENSCTVTSTQDIHLVSSSPHMHRLGVHAKFEVIRAGSGKREVITDRPFDFQEQTDEIIDVVVKNGDKISVTCTYKNDTNQTVMFGQLTDQEMCFNFAIYYPMCGMTCTGGDLFAAAISQTQGGGCPQ
jgi:cytochrome c551/c552